MHTNQSVSYENLALITLDKDTKRRCAMHILGYNYRLYTCFFKDEEFFKFRSDLSPDDVVRKRRKMFKKYLGDKNWKLRAEFGSDNLPKAYHIYKSKCLPNPHNKFQLCSKSHAHEQGKCLEGSSQAVSFTQKTRNLDASISSKYEARITWTNWTGCRFR